MHRHRLDVVSLVSGVAFVLVGLRLLAGPVALRSLPLEWLGPAALLGVGVAMLASLRSRSG